MCLTGTYEVSMNITWKDFIFLVSWCEKQDSWIAPTLFGGNESVFVWSSTLKNLSFWGSYGEERRAVQAHKYVETATCWIVESIFWKNEELFAEICTTQVWTAPLLVKTTCRLKSTYFAGCTCVQSENGFVWKTFSAGVEKIQSSSFPHWTACQSGNLIKRCCFLGGIAAICTVVKGGLEIGCIVIKMLAHSSLLTSADQTGAYCFKA